MNIFENFALAYLKVKRDKQLRKVDIKKPIELLNEFETKFSTSSPEYKNLLQTILQHLCLDFHEQISLTDRYKNFKKELDARLTIFENKPYQLGALDAEIQVLSDILCNFIKPKILEIGVANGYSSAFLYFALQENGGEIFSIDLPKFSRKPIRPSELFRTYLSRKGLIKNSGTLGDLNPGGVIPKEKYAGWLIPFALRQAISNNTITGNAFHIINDFPDDLTFDFAVIDAMKEYTGRMKILELVSGRLKPHGVCFLDGYWVNPAFDDFCSKHQKPFWKFGRVGCFANS